MEFEPETGTEPRFAGQVVAIVRKLDVIHNHFMICGDLRDTPLSRTPFDWIATTSGNFNGLTYSNVPIEAGTVEFSMELSAYIDGRRS